MKTTTSVSFNPGFDWGYWGIAFISFLFWPLGMILYFSYSRNGDEKSSAALLGACTCLFIIIVRIIIAMANIGSAPT